MSTQQLFTGEKKKYDLRPYQTGALDAIQKNYGSGSMSQLIVMATGCGKTLIFSHLPERISGKYLFLAHREDLVEQARTKLEEVHGVPVGVEMASQSSSGEDFIVASVMTLINRLDKFPKDYFHGIVIDEAHHSPNASYESILSHFGGGKETFLLGVTATPDRSDNKGLEAIFSKLSYVYTIRDGIRDGYLAPMRAWTLQTDVSLESVSSRAGDFATGELSTAVNTASRNDLIADEYLRLRADHRPPCVVFCVDIEHASNMRDAFVAKGISCETISSKTPKEERREIGRKFKAGEIEVVTNVDVWTEGFDLESLEIVIMARPTQSMTRYVQAVGRGLRIHPNKKYCTVIDVRDISDEKKNPISAAGVFEMPNEIRFSGQDVLSIEPQVKKIREYDPLYKFSQLDVERIDEIVEELSRITTLNLPPVVVENSRFAFLQFGANGCRLQFFLPNEKKASVYLFENALGQWDLYYEENGSKTMISEYPDAPTAFRAAEELVINKAPNAGGLVSIDARWRSAPASPRQFNVIKRFKKGIVLPTGLTKGQAQILIDRIFQEKDDGISTTEDTVSTDDAAILARRKEAEEQIMKQGWCKNVFQARAIAAKRFPLPERKNEADSDFPPRESFTNIDKTVHVETDDAEIAEGLFAAKPEVEEPPHEPSIQEVAAKVLAEIPTAPAEEVPVQEGKFVPVMACEQDGFRNELFDPKNPPKRIIEKPLALDF